MIKSLSRKKDARNSLLRNLATSLILYEEIITTQAKAKAVKPIVEHLLARASKENLTSRRAMLSYLFDKKAVKKVFEVLVPRYKQVCYSRNKKLNSPYVKIYKVGRRLGDSAEVVIMKLAEGEIAPIAKEDENGKKIERAEEKPARKSAKNPKRKNRSTNN